MNYFLLACLLLCLTPRNSLARNKVDVELAIEPATHSFSCRYTLQAAAVPAAGLVLTLNRQFQLAGVTGPQVREYTSTLFYDAFQKDTLRRLTIRFTSNTPRQRVTVQYKGSISRRFYTDSMADFTAQAGWLPNIPDREYELVTYRLQVQVPETYQVVSTHAPSQAAPGRYTFKGVGPNIEIGAVAARRFTTLVSAGGSLRVLIHKANRPLAATDTLLAADARRIIAFQNRLFGRQDPIRRFTFLLPSVNRSASGLLDNAAVIAYLRFDTRDPEDLLILAHEISHKWWGYGTWNTYDNWLNEGFATYSGLLYLRAAGDTVSFRRELAKRQQAAATAPAVLGFDVKAHDYATLRKVLYDKPTIILYQLHQRLGDAQFFRLLTATAAAKITTTAAFLHLVEKETDRETRQWLTQQLTS